MSLLSGIQRPLKVGATRTYLASFNATHEVVIKELLKDSCLVEINGREIFLPNHKLR